MFPSVGRHDQNGSTGAEAGIALEVIDVVFRDIVGSHPLQQLRNVSGPLPDCWQNNVWRRRQVEAVDIAVAEPGQVEGRFAERFRRRAAGGRHRPAGPVLLDDDRAMSVEGGQFRRTLARWSRPDGDKVINFCHDSSRRYRLDFNLRLVYRLAYNGDYYMQDGTLVKLYPLDNNE